MKVEVGVHDIFSRFTPRFKMKLQVEKNKNWSLKKFHIQYLGLHVPFIRWLLEHFSEEYIGILKNVKLTVP